MSKRWLPAILIVFMELTGAAKAANEQQIREVHVLKMPEEIVTEQVSIETKEVTVYDSLEMLAKCVQAEAGNQGLLGKRLVVDVILNRVDSDRFPNTIDGVISQRGQFAVYPSMMSKASPDEETYQAICMELSNRTDSDILFFSAHRYNSCCTPAYQHGDHYFGY